MVPPSPHQLKVQQLQALSDNLPVMLCFCDREHRYVFANRAYTKRLGYEPAEVVGQTVEEIVGAEAYRKMLPHAEAVLAGQSISVQQELSYRRIGLRSVEIVAVPALDDQQQVIGWICAVTDITDKKRAEEALRTKEQHLRLVTDNAPIMLTQCTTDMRYVWANPRYLQQVGRTIDELIGHTVEDVLGSENFARVRDHIAKVLSGEHVSFDESIDYPGAPQRWLRVSYAPTHGEHCEVTGWIAAITDLTEQKRTADALRQSQLELEVALQSGRMGAWELDFRTGKSRWSPLVSRLFGYSEDERNLTRQHWRARILPEDMPIVEAALSDALGGREEYDAQYRVRWPDGSVHWVQSRGHCFYDQTGAATKILGVVYETTAAKQSEEALREAQSRLKQHADELERKVSERTASLREAIAQMEEFSYAVSHDLRAPLRSIRGFAEVILQDHASELSPAVAEYLQRIYRGSTRMQSLVSDVLTVARITQQKIELRQICLKRLVSDTVADLRERETRAEILIELEPTNVLAHEAMLGQAVSNLLANAIKFVAPDRSPRVRISAERKNGHVRLWVVDNGIGIAPEHQDRIFQMFERVHDRSDIEGSGIGLTIVKKAVERMNGKVGVESDGASGSRFWILLPLAA